MGLISWLKHLFKKKETKPPWLAWEKREVTSRVHIPRKFPKPGSQIISRGYGKHFKDKGKHQHKDYRRSVKARKQPEED